MIRITLWATLLAWPLLLPAVTHADAALLDPNLASQAELEALQNVDADIAEAIVASRPYLTAADLDAALAGSTSDVDRKAIYAELFRPINLNSASESEILLIPGMTKKMAHEFEEYRPYASMEQFRREIGKYVDADEVARLEQYVFIPVNLNNASDTEIMAIPGMTKRMAHEFDEYRPYSDLEQFRREIGKYVDADEVARLESYVTLD